MSDQLAPNGARKTKFGRPAGWNRRSIRRLRELRPDQPNKKVRVCDRRSSCVQPVTIGRAMGRGAARIRRLLCGRNVSTSFDGRTAEAAARPGGR